MTNAVESAQGFVLAVHDYDKTLFMTSEQLENGCTVEAAYDIAVEGVFGSYALKKYREQGGLRNRAPMELVKQLNANTESKDQVVKEQEMRNNLRQCEDLVAAKLAVLLPQVGSRLPDGTFWPRPNEGCANYWRTITGDSSYPIATAILSSGHTDFIKKTFAVHELAAPESIISDDEMRPLMMVLPARMCQKSSRLPMDMLIDSWLDTNIHDNPVDYDINAVTEPVVFAGDDLLKDGLTAKNAGVEFVHVPVGNAKPAFEKLTALVLSKAGLL